MKLQAFAHRFPTIGAGYRIIRTVKRGGMAEVFEAVPYDDRRLHRRLAIKRPLAHANAEQLARFADEAEILRQLQHPGIVSVLDYGLHEGWPFQVLEYIDGTDLAELHDSARGKVPESVALHVMAEAADALHFAHEAVDGAGRPLGIVHCDVSPQNILTTWEGQVKLVDFGIACGVERSPTTHPKGNPFFMSPEQFRCEEATPRTDIFSLGCVLHFLLAGVSPYDTPQAVLASQPRFGRQLHAKVRALIHTAVATDPKERFATAAEFAAACRSLLETLSSDPREELLTCLDMSLSGTTRRRALNPPPVVRARDGLGVAVVSPEAQECTPTVADTKMQPRRPLSFTTPTLPGFDRFSPVADTPGLFLARHVDTHRTVWVRLQSVRDMNDPRDIAQLFAWAAAATVSTEGPSLQVVDFGVDGDRLFVAALAPRGRTLRDILGTERLSLVGIAAIWATVISSVSSRPNHCGEVSIDTITLEPNGTVRLLSPLSGVLCVGPSRLDPALYGTLLTELVPENEQIGRTDRELDRLVPGLESYVRRQSGQTSEEVVQTLCLRFFWRLFDFECSTSASTIEVR